VTPCCVVNLCPLPVSNAGTTGGAIEILSGVSALGASGDLTLRTECAVIAGVSGSLVLSSGTSAGSGSGVVTVATGSATSASGTSGLLSVVTGTALLSSGGIGVGTGRATVSGTVPTLTAPDPLCSDCACTTRPESMIARACWLLRLKR
jgi:hypothetical protein